MNSLVLERLHLVNFKNYPEAELTFSDKINCFVGKNGAGKTNLLDSIYYLSFTKSYFNSSDVNNIRFDEDYMVLEGHFNKGMGLDKIYCGLKRGQKKSLRKNKKEYPRLSDHIGNYPLVIISPADRDLINEGSEVRRKFMDGVISQSDKEYLNTLLGYNKTLAQRNALLKFFAANRTFDAETLEVLDMQLAEKAQHIFEKRKAFIEELLPILQEYHKAISNGSEEISLEYSSNLYESDLQSLLLKVRSKDQVLQYTSVGIHKDDLALTLKNHSLKKTGSQGQQKSFTIALKLAQFEFLKRKTQTVPLLLLDDIFDKLDETRVEALIRLVNEHHFGQIFISDTHSERTRDITKRINEDSRIFEVSTDGKIHGGEQPKPNPEP